MFESRMLLGLALCGCGPPPPPAGPRDSEPKAGASVPEMVAPPDAEATTSVWLKGQLHLHSNASGDSNTPPHEVARWYAEQGYDFIVFTDHNRVSEVPGPEGLLVFAGIELTQNLDSCEPPPETGLACLLHVNGLFVGSDTEALASIPSPARPERLALYAHALAVTEALGGIALLDHPNFHYAADAKLITELAGQGLGLLEIANEAVDSNNGGDTTHPSTEALWDAALTSGARIWGVATDDAHHYYDAAEVRARGELAHVGDRGWVMVRAERDGASIRGAIERGEFYSSNGVVLSEVDFDGAALRVTVDPASAGVHRFVLTGDGGRVLDRARGREAVFLWPEGRQSYMRVTVTDGRGRKAWTQPVWRQD